MDFGTLILYRRGEAPQSIRLRLGSTTIGSDPTADIVVDDQQMAGFHARFVCTPGGCQISDLASPGGTFINRARVPAHTPQKLNDGDRIQMGRIGLIYRQPAEANGQATAAPGEAPAPERAADGQASPPAPAPPPAPTPPPAPAQAPATRAIVDLDPAPDGWAELFQAPALAEPNGSARRLRSNRRARRIERDLPYASDDYLALLPPIYGDSDSDSGAHDFLRRFLLIFKSILDPLDRTISQIHYYFDPRLAPEQLLPWLASWVDLVLDEHWPIERRRELIGAASVLYRWRGTRRGMQEYLQIYTGVAPQIVEPGEERPDLGEPRLPPHTFRVVIDIAGREGVDRSLIERIIEAEKPAHTSYQLDLRGAR